jgi:hypothetical protein
VERTATQLTLPAIHRRKGIPAFLISYFSFFFFSSFHNGQR